MFDKKEINGIFEKFQKRTSEVNNLDRIPVLDAIYLNFLSKYKGLEITPDIQLFGYEDALSENKYIEENFSAIYNYLWIIGRSGQGDEWFISKETSTILFYDHDNGEYSSAEGLQDFNMNFLEFLQAAFMLHIPMKMTPSFRGKVADKSAAGGGKKSYFLFN